MPRGGRHIATQAAGHWGRGSPARELAPVRVNAITPSLIDTPLLHTADGWERSTFDEKRACMLSGKRVGTADEVAQARNQASFLAFR
jgi:NAD(P)-dependent dehydrogenase (short-subunit alcohol dehydrogenase family)